METRSGKLYTPRAICMLCNQIGHTIDCCKSSHIDVLYDYVTHICVFSACMLSDMESLFAIWLNTLTLYELEALVRRFKTPTKLEQRLNLLTSIQKKHAVFKYLNKDSVLDDFTKIELYMCLLFNIYQAIIISFEDASNLIYTIPDDMFDYIAKLTVQHSSPDRKQKMMNVITKRRAPYAQYTFSTSFAKNKPNKNAHDSCPICFDDVENVNMVHTNCSHSFCKVCLDAYFAHSYTKQVINCPYCRTDIMQLKMADRSVVELFKNKYCRSIYPVVDWTKPVQEIIEIVVPAPMPVPVPVPSRYQNVVNYVSGLFNFHR